MPIRAYLGGLRFDPETTRLMAVAFEMALVALQRTDGIVNPTREAVAKKIIELAKAGATETPLVRSGGGGAGSHPLLVAAHHLAIDQTGPHLEVVHGLDDEREPI